MKSAADTKRSFRSLCGSGAFLFFSGALLSAHFCKKEPSDQTLKDFDERQRNAFFNAQFALRSLSLALLCRAHVGLDGSSVPLL